MSVRTILGCAYSCRVCYSSYDPMMNLYALDIVMYSIWWLLLWLVFVIDSLDGL